MPITLDFDDKDVSFQENFVKIPFNGCDIYLISDYTDGKRGLYTFIPEQITY